jgi:hypothetical protein
MRRMCRSLDTWFRNGTIGSQADQVPYGNLEDVQFPTRTMTNHFELADPDDSNREIPDSTDP